jgi:predicted short-subunit dehydrogenase-like oxidoreductase (DUF2520 family)
VTKQGRRTKKKPTVTIIGAGRLGTALALALTASGYSVEALVARRLGRARKAKKLLSGQMLAISQGQLYKLPESELLIIATPDDVIPSIAAKLAEAQREMRVGRTVLHTSGAHSSAVLSPLAEAGFQLGSLHPLVSVSNPASGVNDLRHAFYCLEGDRAALRVARSLVHDLGGYTFSIESDKKSLYHAAAVMASGHLVALFDISVETLTACGLDRLKARQVLLPLLQSTAKNLLVWEPAQALTGTFARGDLATVRKHLAALNTRERSDALAIYKLLGRRSLKLAERNGLEPALAKLIDRVLELKPADEAALDPRTSITQ